MTVLEQLKSERETQVKLESGRLVTIRLPWIQECIAAIGDVPLPVLSEITDLAQAEAPQLNGAQMRAVSSYNQALVRAAVVAIEGEPVVLPAAEPVSAYFDEDEAMEIVGYASRQTPLPGKA